MPAIEVSCPACGELKIIEMKPHSPIKGSFSDMLKHIVAGSGVKHYMFIGNGKCGKCGEAVDVALNVSTRGNEVMGGLHAAD